MNMAWHDSDFAFAGRDDSGAIGSDQPRSLSFEKGACPDHVECWNAFGDANDQFDAGGGRFHDRVGRIWRRYENDRCIGSRLAPRFFNSIEDIEAFVFDAAFARRDSPHHVRPVLHGLNRVKPAFTFLSERRMRKAFFTCSADAPPPTSRKFAGLPPAILMMSIVPMARPAPLTMHATLPSNLM